MAGSLVYSALFVMLSVVTSRALIAGLVYVFIWEGLVNGLFAGTRILSVRHYTLAVADVFVDLPGGDFEAKLASSPRVLVMAVVGGASDVVRDPPPRAVRDRRDRRDWAAQRTRGEKTRRTTSLTGATVILSRLAAVVSAATIVVT